eukprot:scaffold34627_cov159-Amphora_coffeaeformis.AAC.7
MSGLTVFFRDFLPKDNASRYEQSTAILLLVEEEEEDASCQDEWTEPLTFKSWKNLEKQVLNTYLQHRVLVSEEKEEDTATTSTQDKVGMSQPSQDSAGYSQELETQGFYDLLEDKKSEALPHLPPHVNDAIHTAEYLTDVDLRSKQTNLRVLQADRYWQMRKTNRLAATNVVPRRQPVIEIYQGPLKVPLSPCEDDGPLSCIYRLVLSLEVSQVNKPTSSLRQRATAAMQQEISVHRMKMFLYNGYADEVNSIISKLSGTQRLLLQVQKIPPQCIFPLGMTSWVDCDLSQYCICLGDKSKLMLEDQNGTDYFLRFDAPEMELSAAIVEGDEIVKEYRILPGDSKLFSEEVLPDDRMLGPAYVLEGSNHGTAQEMPQLPGPSDISEPEAPQAASNADEPETPRAANPESPAMASASDVHHQIRLHPPTPKEMQIKEPPRPPRARVEDGTRVADNVDPNPKRTDTVERMSQREENPRERGAGDETGGKESNAEQMEVMERPKLQQERAEMVDPIQRSVEIPHEQNPMEQPGANDSALEEMEVTEQTRPQQENETNVESQNINASTNITASNEDGSDVENDTSRLPGIGASASTSYPPPLSTVNNNQVREALSFRVIYNQEKEQSSPRPGKKPKETHFYHRLGDLRAHLDSHKAISKEQMTNSACIVDILAVVLGFGHPSRTKRGDWMVSVTLVDDSLPLETESSTTDSLMAVNVNIFVKEEFNLPKLRFAGDVLRLHRVKLQEWNNEIQLLGIRASSYVVCCKEGPEVTLYPTSTSFTVSEQEKRRFTEMWKWGQYRLCNCPTMKTSVSFKLADVHQNKFCTRHVTDGDPPGEALVRLADLVRKISKSQPDKPALREPHTVTGRVVNVAIWDSTYWDSVEEVIRIGTFVRLRNIQDSKLDNTDVRCLHVHSKSHMTPLPEMTFEVIRLIEDHNARLERNDETNPSSGILPLEESDATQEPARPVNSPRVREASPIRRSPKRRKQVDQQPGADFRSLLNNDRQSSFAGDVNIVGTIPAFPILARGGIANIISARHSFAVKLEDNDLNQIDAIVNGQTEAAWKILGCGSAGTTPRVDHATEFLRTSIKRRWRWTAQVRSVMLSGAKYFVLDNIKQCDVDE